LESVRKVLVDGQKVKAVSLEWDIPEGVLYRWIGEFQKHPDDVFPGHGKRTTKDQEVYDLKRKLSQVEQERDILKKRWSTSPTGPNEIRLYRRAPGPVSDTADVPGAGG
jgi:transposase